MKGYDIDILNTISSSVNIPVIASGGAGKYEHMWEAIDYGGVSAVAAASMFHFTEQTPQERKNSCLRKAWLFALLTRIKQTPIQTFNLTINLGFIYILEIW
ncbi:MAG: hypothetical protein CM15mP98_06400 [Paracoccaceae bacterium]|nr:MAG: hypothetical protein CM15mP98_06400 [Paracoccaceae bacterium]